MAALDGGAAGGVKTSPFSVRATVLPPRHGRALYGEKCPHTF